MLGRMHLMVVLLTLIPRYAKRHRLSRAVMFSTTMVSASLYGREHPPPSVAAPGRLFALRML